jgi:DDE family transposase
MSLTLLRSGEDVSAFIIGKFGDTRLSKIGALLFKRLSEKLTICIKSLGGDRATEVAFNRFLSNESVEPEIISDELSKKANQSCLGKSHVLCLQDTVQLTYPTQSLKKDRFGSTSDANTKGLFVHPGIIVDASNRDVIGASSIIAWCRNEQSASQGNKARTIEEKESIRWITTALSAKKNITNAEIITVIGDRESDIFEIFERVPDERTHLIVRASHDRILDSDEKISVLLENTKIAGTHKIKLPAITGKRKARIATLAIKYTPISLRNPAGALINIFCVSALEISPIPSDETPISWVLLTTHLVSSLKSAIQILTWYTWRWIIEQIFRIMKNKGLKIEDSQIEDPKKLQVLSLLCVATAIKVMSLVESRDGRNNRSASDLYTKNELILMVLLCKKLEGKTEKQKNPYVKNSMSWAAWIIARLGGWNGYRSESPPGPIVMLRGLQKLELQYEGWLLAQ